MNNNLKIRSIRLNFILNIGRMLLSFLTPLVILPYINRNLTPEGIGKVDFVNSIVSYFILFTTMGIPTYGMREIARIRDDVKIRSQTVWELTIILCINVSIGYTVYFFSIFIIPNFKDYFFLFCIIAPTIFLSSFNYDWFYIGIENQVYITIRYVIVKILQIICIFLFVNKPEDYLLYAMIMVGLDGVSSLFNIFHLHRYIHFVPLKELAVVRHLRPIVIIFSSALATSIYAHLDTIMIGFYSGDRAVGIYTTANKLVRMIITIVTAMAVIVIPRLEHSLKKGDNEAYLRYLNVSLRYVLSLALPCVVGIIALADDIILLFAGVQYIESGLVVRILSPIILLIGLSYLLGMEILYPHRKELQYTIAVAGAAVVNAFS